MPWEVPHPGAFFIAWDPAVPVPAMTNGQPRAVSVGGRPLARIRDGAANTLLLAECVVNWPFIKRYSGALGGYRDCLAGLEPPLTDNQTSSGGRGKSWFMGTWSQDWTFTTHFPPNDPITQGVECELWTHQGVYGARSRHPGVVNAALADGSVRGVTDAVDVVVWRGLGTVAGRETGAPAW